MADKLTVEQAVVITAFTGIFACEFADFHAYAERKLGRPVWTHEFGDPDFTKELKNNCRGDFLDLLPVDV